jgi:putative transposase
MPRPPRAADGGLIDHAENRANARMSIFGSEDDYAAFLRVLSEVLARY